MKKSTVYEGISMNLFIYQVGLYNENRRIRHYK
jgi:hypothetical protein